MLLINALVKKIKDLTHFVNELHYDQLENVTKSMNLVNACAKVIQSSILKEMNNISKVMEMNTVVQVAGRNCKSKEIIRIRYRPDQRESAS